MTPEDADGKAVRPHAAAGRARADRDRVARRDRGAAARAARAGRSRTPTRTCRITRENSTPPACIPTTAAARGPRANSVHRQGRSARTTIRSACSRCRARRSRAFTPRPARRASRPSSAIPRGDIDTWADLMARTIRAAGGAAGRHAGARRLRLRPVHRRPRRALRRRAAGLHGDADVGRHDRAAGAADPRFRARDHHGDAELHAGDPRRVPRGRGSIPRASSLADRHLRRRALDQRDARRDRGTRSTSTPSTCMACRR